jgi:hypothetical protein
MKVRPLLAPFALALVVAPVLADAPPDQYRPFVRTDPEVRDAQTGLIWLRAPTAPATFDSALSACPTQAATYRLPTMKELLTLVDEQPHDEYENGAFVPKAIDGNAFPSTPAVLFWTGSSNAADATTAWAVDFKTGAASLHPKAEAHVVRCVRP